MSVYNAYLALSGIANIKASMDERLSYRTSYRIGGAAKLFCSVSSYSALIKTIETLDAEGVDWVIMGRGSNILVSDDGYQGCVIKLEGEFTKIHIDEKVCTLTAGGGALLSKAVAASAQLGLSGLEAYVGIPGTIGGAMSTNAGTRREWISAKTSSLVVYIPGAGLKRIEAAELDWGYRSVNLRPDAIVLEANFELVASTKERVLEELEKRQRRLAKSQPMGVASCGAIFKDAGDRSADELIRECGLVGKRFGGCVISDVNANFFVNDRRATAMDVIGLIHVAHDTVQKKMGIHLSPELKFLGFGA